MGKIFQSVLLCWILLCVPSFGFLGRLKEIQKTSTGGGVDCASCVIVVSLLEQYSEIHEQSIEEVLEDVCNLFPLEVSAICDYYVATYGDVIIKLFDQDFHPDDICQSLSACTDPTCRLVPSTNIPNTPVNIKIMDAIPSVSPWDWIMDIINRVASHKPAIDFDGDYFTDVPELRGSNWRGRDCQVFDPNIHAGRKVNTDPNTDWNCNGIYGTNNQGVSYETQFCGQSGPKGVAVLGDSFGAHFSIPPSWLTAADINETTYKNLLTVVSDEFDWPHQSGWTGYDEKSYLGFNVSSIYKYMRTRNLCNHRDYQNVAVNGARSGSLYDSIIGTLARNQTLDNPLMVIFELIGNDVCNGHHTFDAMTTVPEFRQNIMDSLNYLNTVLPAGSTVVFLGLADGRELWDLLHNRTHPIGVTYQEVYDFLNCLNISPCWVWMNSNATVRTVGSERAANLTKVYQEIISNETFSNFDMLFFEFPFPQIRQMWEKIGGKPWELIEPVDGFHPNGIAHSLIAQYIWGQLETNYPSSIGAVNPMNSQIETKFGDQGGY